MKTSSFFAALRAHAGLPLVFRAGARELSPHYHLTEVKRVSYETMDCGGELHRWSETQLELWVPPVLGALPGRSHLLAEKFLRIIDRVEAALPLNADTNVHLYASFGGQPAALHEVTKVAVEASRLVVSLQPLAARCKAVERRASSLLGGCCGAGTAANSASTDASASDAGCGCSTAATPGKEPAICCA